MSMSQDDAPVVRAFKLQWVEKVLARAGNSTSSLYAIDVEALVDLLFDLDCIPLDRLARVLQKYEVEAL